MQSSQDAHATCADGERGTSGEVPGTIIRLFEEQAARTPEAIALVCNGRSLTYGQLDDRAKRLAHRLQNMGVGAETLVGIFMGRSVEMVAALLATLKAGGAYVPVDPDYPGERIALVLADCRASVVLTTGRDRGKLPTIAGRVVSIDSEETDNAD